MPNYDKNLIAGAQGAPASTQTPARVEIHPLLFIRSSAGDHARRLPACMQHFFCSILFDSQQKNCMFVMPRRRRFVESATNISFNPAYTAGLFFGRIHSGGLDVLADIQKGLASFGFLPNIKFLAHYAKA